MRSNTARLAPSRPRHAAASNSRLCGGIAATASWPERAGEPAADATALRCAATADQSLAYCRHREVAIATVHDTLSEIIGHPARRAHARPRVAALRDLRDGLPAADRLG